MKKLIAVVILALIGIQFIPVERTNPPVTSDIVAPAKVKEVLKRACYDCHSNETNWVWYTKVAPSSFLAVSDVNNARKHLNFSEWNLNKEAKAKEEIWDELREEQMPPWQYKIFHSEAKLTIEEKNLIRNWATNK
jgi:hypothetical protein